jgi:hypothetical protein
LGVRGYLGPTGPRGKGDQGEQGERGPTGMKGEMGVGIYDAYSTAPNTLVLVLTSGKQIVINMH